MSRILLDTGVFLQAARNPTGEGAAILRLLDGTEAIELITSQSHLLELSEVLARSEAGKVAIDPARAEAIVRHFEDVATLESDLSPRRASYTSDPDDDFLVALALRTHARLVTYDRAIHRDHPPSVEVLSPREFLHELQHQDEAPPG